MCTGVGAFFTSSKSKWSVLMNAERWWDKRLFDVSAPLLVWVHFFFNSFRVCYCWADSSLHNLCISFFFCCVRCEKWTRALDHIAFYTGYHAISFGSNVYMIHLQFIIFSDGNRLIPFSTLPYLVSIISICPFAKTVSCAVLKEWCVYVCV